MKTVTELILTREPRDNKRLISIFEKSGITIREYPCISTELKLYDGTLIENSFHLDEFQVIAFTSKRGVFGMAPVADEISRSSVRLAAVGTTTADAVREIFHRDPEFIPEIQTGEVLANFLVDALKCSGTEGIRILHVRGNTYSPLFRSILESAGLTVAALEVYSTRIPVLEPVFIREKAVILFASPSAVRAFFTANTYQEERMICVAIGPVTCDALQKKGVDNIIMSPSSRHEDVAETIVNILGL